jgi:hypothetical protein
MGYLGLDSCGSLQGQGRTAVTTAMEIFIHYNGKNFLTI